MRNNIIDVETTIVISDRDLFDLLLPLINKKCYLNLQEIKSLSIMNGSEEAKVLMTGVKLTGI